MHMFPALILAVTVVVASSHSPFWRPNHLYPKSIPDHVPSNVSVLTIENPSIPLTAETFKRFTKLKRLNLQRINGIRISKDMFKYLTNLRTLNIEWTDLNFVDRDWFMYTPYLKNVWIHFNNRLTSLTPDTFWYLRLLESVNLENNRLTSLSPQIFIGTSLKVLSLQNNPWICDCGMAMFMRWTKDNRVMVRDNPVCAQPPRLRGLNLKDPNLMTACYPPHLSPLGQ